jgi:RHS repeat-associated protein
MNFEVTNYRYSFNGKEDIDNSFQDYGARYYNKLLGRFISADPLIVKEQMYAELSSYQFAGNKPIVAVDLDGFEELPIIDFSKYIIESKKYLEKKTAEYIKKITTKIIKDVYESLDEMQKSKIWQAKLTYEFITGTGPEERFFGPDHPLTMDIKRTNMTTIALKEIYYNYTNKNAEEGDIVVEFPNFTRLGDTGPLREYIADKEYTAAQFLGTAHYIYKINFNEKMIDIEVYDTKSEESLLYHLPGTDRHSRKENPFMGETIQHYYFSISFDEFTKRTGLKLEKRETDNNNNKEINNQSN